MDTFQAEKPHLVKTVTWSADGLQGEAKGKGFNGSFQVTATHIVVEINLSWIALPFKAKAESRLREQFVEEFGA